MDQESDKLLEVGTRILSDWGMMMVENSAPNTQVFGPDQPLYMAWVNMRGARKGTLSIVAQTPFMENLARNLLGLDACEAPSSDEQKDAFKELGNVLAGNFFTAAFGEDTVFDLIYPNVVEVDQDELDSIKRRGSFHTLIADDAPVSLTFTSTDA